MTFSEPGKLRLTDPAELVQGVLAVVVIGALAAIAVMGREIPDQLMYLAVAVVAFYFGKTVHAGTSSPPGVL